MALNSILRVDVFLHTVKSFSVVVMVQCDLTHVDVTCLLRPAPCWHRHLLTSRTFLSENRGDRARGEATSSALSVLPALYHSLREDFRVNSKGERENRSDLTRG